MLLLKKWVCSRFTVFRKIPHFGIKYIEYRYRNRVTDFRKIRSHYPVTVFWLPIAITRLDILFLNHGKTFTAPITFCLYAFNWLSDSCEENYHVFIIKILFIAFVYNWRHILTYIYFQTASGLESNYNCTAMPVSF